MKKIKLEDIKNCQGDTNWSVVMQQTDADIAKAVSKSDDAKLLTEAELVQLRSINSEQIT